MASERRRRLVAIGLAVLLFGSGVATGIAIDRALIDSESDKERWERRRPEVLTRKYAEALDLDPAQTASVQEILERRWRATADAFGRVDPEVNAARARARDQIRALLREDQRPRFEEMVVEEERRRAAMRKSLRGD